MARKRGVFGWENTLLQCLKAKRETGDRKEAKLRERGPWPGPRGGGQTTTEKAVWLGVLSKNKTSKQNPHDFSRDAQQQFSEGQEGEPANCRASG